MESTPKIKILRAMFDVKPIDESGSIDFAKLENLPETIKLRDDKKTELLVSEQKVVVEPLKGMDREILKMGPERREILSEFEKTISGQANLAVELKNIGASFHESKKGKPKKQGYLELPRIPQRIYTPPDNLPIAKEDIFEKTDSFNLAITEQKKEPEKKAPLAEERPKTASLAKMDIDSVLDDFMVKNVQVSSPIARELDFLLEGFKKESASKKSIPLEANYFHLFSGKKNKKKFSGFLEPKKSKGFLKKIIMGTALVSIFAFFIQKGVDIKNDILNDSNRAVVNLQDAKGNLENFNFISAARNFSLAGDNFSVASSRLNLAGASLASLFSDVPGLSKIKSAKNLLKAGESASKAGETLALAFDNLARTNFVSYFGSEQVPGRSLSDFLNQFRELIISANNNIKQSQKLLADIDVSILPEEKRGMLLDFKDKIPEFQNFIAAAVNYSDFLLETVGNSGPKKYLILFQNNSELRPTGGFPGTYGILEFDGGYLTGIFVGDIYDIDGQIRDNIVPPRELQHITPTWGMRDANWFSDFPTSAKKVMEMYELDGGPEVDGVFTLTPTVISKILKITGSIEMPEYEKTLDSENFLSEVQEEVEYGVNKETNQPKKIVIDFVPKFIAKLSEQDRDSWIKIFQILVDSISEKHILAYFKDPKLQKISLENGLAGEIMENGGDFLLVSHSNVKGSKTDAVIKNLIDLKSEVSKNGFMEHTLKISRVHSGGKTPYGFYNRQNPDYIRAFVPSGSELIGISGNSEVNTDPLIEYDGTFSVDDDLKKYEAGASTEKNIKILNESGKTVFGFWMLLNPGETKTVTLKYLTPIKVESGEYSLLIQKQPGTIQDKLSFSFVPPDDKNIVFRYPDSLQAINGAIVLDSDLLIDRVVGLRWK